MLSLTVVCWGESVSGGSLCYSIQLGTVHVYVEKSVSMRPVIWCGGECLRSFGINGIGWKVFFSAEFYPAFKTLNTIQMCVFLHVQRLHSSLAITPSQNPLLQTLPHLYIPSPVSLPLSKPLQWVSGKDGAISACVSSVCGPSAACLQHQVSAFVCVGVWEKNERIIAFLS